MRKIIVFIHFQLFFVKSNLQLHNYNYSHLDSYSIFRPTFLSFTKSTFQKQNIISHKSSKIFFNQISFCRMVFYFTCQSRPDLAQKYIIYMGRDKFENEALIHNGWPEDLWFHVDGQFYKKK